LLSQALAHARTLRADFAVSSALPAGDWDKLVQTSHAARAALVLNQLFKMDGDQLDKIQAELRQLRSSCEHEKKVFPSVFVDKIVKALLSG